MTDADLKKYAIGRQFINLLNNGKWTITSVNVTDDYIWAETDYGHKCRIFIDNFDQYHQFLDEETPTLYGVPLSDWGASVGPKCGCGADSYYGVDKGPHSDYCEKSDKKKGSFSW